MAGDQVIAEKVAERADEGVAVRAASTLVEAGIGPLTDSGPAAMARAVNVVRVRGTTTATRRLPGVVMGTLFEISGIDQG